MKGGTYTKTLAKIQVRGIFRIRDIRRNVLARFTQIYRDLYGDAMLVLIRMSSNGGRKPTETSVTEFCYQSVNLFEFILRRTRKH